MKYLLFLPLFLLLFACTGQNGGTYDTVFSASCSCDEKRDKDTVFFATKVNLEEVNGKKIIHYNCAAVAVAIASVSDEDGMERCENLYEQECVSPVKNSLVLSDSFTYFAEEMEAVEFTVTSAQNSFFEALKRAQTGYFKFTIVNKELKAISKINLQ